jgi:putative transposase
MARPLRFEFPGGVYHITSRGDRREAIFLDDSDRACLLLILGEAAHRFDVAVFAYCLMGNHYHFVLHTRQDNLSRIMRHLNGVYSQAFNRRHGLVGHLFQGRFKSIHVDRDAYLMEVCRYVDLNPVRAGMVRTPDEWPWSSYRAHVGSTQPAHWLDTSALHGYLLGRDPVSEADARHAASLYAQLVADGIGVHLWGPLLRQEIYLGDEAFIERVQAGIKQGQRKNPEIPRMQRKVAKTVTQWLATSASREEAVRRAYIEGGMSMSDIAKDLGKSVSWISRLIRRAETGQ